MGSRGFQRIKDTIGKNEGLILSTDTLNLEQLTISGRDFIIYNEIEEGYSIVKAINVLFDENENYMEQMYPLYQRGMVKDTFNDDEMEQMEYLWHEEIYELFNDVCPGGHYFGSTDGDGACIGFFEYNED